MTDTHTASAPAPARSLSADLHNLCLDFHRHPYPHVPNPAGCKRRASVALIIRIRPTYPDVPAAPALDAAASVEEQLGAFFTLDWVARGDPEVLFIKRAARRGDRFTSHVAFPGGKRDPEDASDEAAALRETLEEVGLDLTAACAVPIGNLAERVVMSEWGGAPLLVLCPFIYLLPAPTLPVLRLQPSEVHGAHWVPLRALLDPDLRTWERADVSDRLPRLGTRIQKVVLRLLLGQMMYAATYLVPSASVYASEGPGFLPPPAPATWRARAAAALAVDHAGAADPARPLRLWGLTHGMIADFLDLLPGHNATGLMAWPTFSAPDVRLVTWLVTHRFRRSRRILAPGDHNPAAPLTDRLGVRAQEPLPPPNEGRDPAGVPSPTPVQRAVEAESGGARDSAMWVMFKNYFALMRRAVYITMALRVGVLGVLGAVLLRRWRIRRLQAA